MKTLVAILMFAVLGCGTPSGGDTSVSVDVNQNQNASAATSSEPSDPCSVCVGSLSKITDCLAGFGMELADCE